MAARIGIRGLSYIDLNLQRCFDLNSIFNIWTSGRRQPMLTVSRGQILMII